MRSGNPVLRNSILTEAERRGRDASIENADFAPMTIQGTMTKAALLLLIATATASFTWKRMLADPSSAYGWTVGGAIGALVLVMIISFKPKLAPTLAVPYAAIKGLFLGGFSAIYAMRAGELVIGGMALGSNIVLQAIVITVGVALAMLGLYAFRVITVTDRMRSIVLAATGGVFIFYLIAFALSFFGISVPLIHSSGPLGILFSAFVIGLAAFNLLIDFEWIERGSKQGAPRSLEWFGAFALVVTLIWLYIEIVRMISKLQSRD